MIKVITNSLGTGDWITVLGHSGTELFNGHSIGARELHEILNIVSRDGCDLIEVDDQGLEEGEWSTDTDTLALCSVCGAEDGGTQCGMPGCGL
jgi:hypothetical protein